MIIDAHVHLYPDKIAAKAAQNIGAFYDLPMAYDGSLAQLKAACQRAGVAACVLCSVATAPAQAHSINVFLADAKTRLGWAALCALHPAMAPQEVTAALDFAQAQGMVGAKLHPDFQRFCADDPAVFPLYGALAARGMPLLLHAGDARFRFSNPQKIARLLQAFPTLTVVAAHFGGWTEWEDAVQTLAGQYKNLYVDTCSSLHWLSPARARGVVRAFGANKVLFGTDYPMWDAADELAMLRAAGLRQTELELVLHKNAEHVYRLQPRRV